MCASSALEGASSGADMARSAPSCSLWGRDLDSRSEHVTRGRSPCLQCTHTMGTAPGTCDYGVPVVAGDGGVWVAGGAALGPAGGRVPLSAGLAGRLDPPD